MNLKKCVSIQNKTIRDVSHSLSDLKYTHSFQFEGNFSMIVSMLSKPWGNV